MWSSSSTSNVDLLFPRRPRRGSGNSNGSSTRRSSATSRLEQRRRDLPPHSVSTGGLWAFDGPSTSSASFTSSPTVATDYSVVSAAPSPSEEPNAAPPGLQKGLKTANHGVIGSYSSGEVTARMLWNRPEREEEEREEEALPSYLSYLQAPSHTGDTTAAALPAPASFGPIARRMSPSSDDVREMKSQQLARALQEYIMVQMQGVPGSSNAVGGCSCERRVIELEKQVQSLLAAQKQDNTASEETGSAVGDRVSTLEGRQSAFQSQLAQISKVLGVPVGKHGKSSQLKTLVQTLHEEIDSKVQSAVADVEAACVASATKRTEQLIAEAATSSSPAGESSTPSESNDDKKQQLPSDYDTSSASGLPFATVLNALAEEHEASLTRLSTHFDERLRLEGSQRIAVEGRVRARLGELEEWLQQVEGELGGSHFQPSVASASIPAMTKQLNALQTQLNELESSWKPQRQEVHEISAKMEKLPDLDALQAQQRDDMKALRDNIASLEAVGLSTRDETLAVTRTSQGLKLIVEKLVRDTGSAEELLQQYVSTITHQVASVTRQYVSVRIRDNNRLLDATLRARVPDYVANESESFLLVRPETKKDEAAGTEEGENFSFVLREDDENGIRRLLATQRAPKPSTIGNTISSDASAVVAAAGGASLP
ncbi:hypothetical protein GN244_ATG04461 [Phytophthora infestans]|uniref:Uncharacterized protein n=1 Tax=Phytophthora infestans TaxID=4787 RepID=A0A833WZ84_PHYIN|nr:hypothetical protein GN244_ATG04461 [Phytophthora infestans]